MEQIDTFFGPVKIYALEETREMLLPLRDSVFCAAAGIGPLNDRIFVDDAWAKVLVRGALWQSDRSQPPQTLGVTVEEWALDDPRDELHPLFEMLVEDGIDEVFHMSPWVSQTRLDAIGTRPTRCACSYYSRDVFAGFVQERLLFDRTGRWGFYGSEEMFGLLGGEPEFIERYIARCGGMEFIREKADKYWQLVIDEKDFEAKFVPLYYELAGWDNPPRKRDE